MTFFHWRYKIKLFIIIVLRCKKSNKRDSKKASQLLIDLMVDFSYNNI